MAYDERKRPSLISLIMVIIPPIIIYTVFYLTEGFSAQPNRPQFHYSILPLILMVISIVISVMNFLLTRDEEPEWGSVFLFKLIEGLDIAYITMSVLIIVLVVLFYLTS